MRLRAAGGPRAVRIAAEALLVGLLSVACAAVVLHLWRADLALPLRYAPVDDTKFYLMLVKGIVEHGSYLSNPSLGAPFGQQLSDYPQGADDLSLLLVGGLSLLSANAALVVNLFYLLTFALAGFTAHAVLRSLGVGTRAAAVAAVLYSLEAYHFFRGESHLLLSAYYAVPLAAYLFLALIAEDPLFTRAAGGSGKRLARPSRRTLATVGICAVIGSANLYYATFAVTMLLAVVLLMAAARRWRSALSGLALAALIVAALLVNLSPSLLYRSAHGANRALERSAAFTERSQEAFSLRPANLVLPAPASRIAPLRELAARYDDTIAPGYCEACYGSLGTVGTVGLGWLALCTAAALLGAGAWQPGRRLLRHAGLGVAIALTLGTVGGVASLAEVFLTADIRAWNRISILIAFFALLAAALLLEAALARLRRVRRGGVLGMAALAAVLAFGVYDQTNESFVPSYAATATQWRSDQHFVEQIEARLPSGAEVLQLPYVPFPEGYPETPTGDRFATYATKYEPLRGYLHSTSLRWSYGAIKGRAADWQAQLAGQPLGYVVSAGAVAGFDGLWVDPSGFPPAKAQAIRQALERLLGGPPLLSPLADLWFFDLRAQRARLVRADPPGALALLRRATLNPIRLTCAARTISLENPSSTPQAVTLAVRVPSASGAYASDGAVVPDGQAGDIPASATATVHLPMVLPPGRTLVPLDRLALPTGALARALYATVTPDPLLRFAAPAHSAAAGTLEAGLTGPPCA